MLAKQPTHSVVDDPEDDPAPSTNKSTAKAGAGNATNTTNTTNGLQQAKNAAGLRQRLGGGAFKPKERTPSPSEERDQKPLARGATKLTKASIFDNDDEDEQR